MLDKTIPFYSLIMETEHPDEYPRFDLPDGFSFVLWEPGLETEWARIHTDLGQFKSIEEGEKVFMGEFLDRPELARKRCFFVKAANGAVVATASLWDGDLFGPILPRIHWSRSRLPGRDMVWPRPCSVICSIYSRLLRPAIIFTWSPRPGASKPSISISASVFDRTAVRARKIQPM